MGNIKISANGICCNSGVILIKPSTMSLCLVLLKLYLYLLLMTKISFYLYKHPFSEGILLNMTFCSEIEASRALISIKVTKSFVVLSDASEI